MKIDDIKSIGIVGAGQMGRGIAQVCAASGYRVLLVDVSGPALEKAFETLLAGLQRAVQRGVLLEGQAGTLCALIHPVLDLDRLREAQVVIEAVPEDPTLKGELFETLDRTCPAETVLASNTSSIAIATLAAVCRHQDRVVGMHFMNPVPVMKLVEVVRGQATSDATADLVLDLAGRLGKTPVISKDVPGFIVNRVLIPMINEAVFTLEQGIATIEDIDLAMVTGANHPMGPLALADRIGLDTVLAICEVLHRDLGDPKFRPCPLLRRYVEAGWFGRKSGRGFYRYGESDRAASIERAHSEAVR